jgi:hypothetical protein
LSNLTIFDGIPALPWNRSLKTTLLMLPTGGFREMKTVLMFRWWLCVHLAARRVPEFMGRDTHDCPTISNSITRNDGHFRILGGVCRVYAPIQPFTPTITLARTGVQTIENPTLEGRTEAFELKRSDGQTIILKAGFVLPLAWIPLPLMGCAGGGSQPWSCGVSFFRTDVMPLGSIEGEAFGGTAGAIARALKLPPASVSARYPEPPG